MKETGHTREDLEEGVEFGQNMVSYRAGLPDQINVHPDEQWKTKLHLQEGEA